MPPKIRRWVIFQNPEIVSLLGSPKRVGEKQYLLTGNRLSFQHQAFINQFLMSIANP